MDKEVSQSSNVRKTTDPIHPNQGYDGIDYGSFQRPRHTGDTDTDAVGVACKSVSYLLHCVGPVGGCHITYTNHNYGNLNDSRRQEPTY